MIACLFSGQGAQTPDMGRDLAKTYSQARKTYARAAAVLGYDLLSMTQADLQSTRFAQLAIVTMSLAAWQVFAEQVPPQIQPFFAGFSLGEYSALAAAGILELEELLDLVNERARLMQAAADKYPGSMYAIIGMDEEKIREELSLPQWQNAVYAANFNAPGQIVIAGREDQTARCAERLLERGARRAVKLSVSGAFHTPMMQEAAASLAEYARKFNFRKPDCPVYANTLGTEVPADIAWPDLLARHMTSPVLWIDEVRAMAVNNPSCWLEFGPGTVLTGLVRKIVASAPAHPVRDSQDMQKAISLVREAF